MRARPSPQRVASARALARHARSARSVTVNQCSVLLGTMASMVDLVPLGRLHMRPFQRWFLAHRLDTDRQRRVQIPMTPRSSRALSPWVNASLYQTYQAFPWGRRSSGRWCAQTPHSRGGAPCVTATRLAAGGPFMTRGTLTYWSSMLYAWRSSPFGIMLCGFHVLVRSDNTLAIAYVNRQGGVRSSQLNKLAREIYLWALPWGLIYQSLRKRATTIMSILSSDCLLDLIRVSPPSIILQRHPAHM